MPDDRKWIDARDFKEEGFLQESNRLFFHPHGLALAITLVKDDDDAPIYTFALTAAQRERLLELAGGDEELTAVIAGAARYDVDDAYFQGVWDLRDDPEGVVFGSWDDGDRAKVEHLGYEWTAPDA